ncbi:hypothetical protein B5M09_009486 [Aphanomyces astaci]|uniref:Peroxin-13 n=2 Tax=Aphanomyces astaci TaxID=112090 RepID=A0A397A6U0_APHAT|nr:hypothetical protein DYB36_000575 [Aphanomyces astaci]RHY53059.1 hypothetical protein DYB34_004206 [Aphanomyces astaci]RHZ42149.1 hypothetical protein DYB26_014633 [Aphanomyces astaci]RQM21090.1 hypothetical protein B5M09_009486 [Aphanomyces astaci]
MGWLVSFNQTVSAIGQITQVLGMNAESLNFCFGSFVHFMERMAFLTTNAVAMLSPKPVFRPGHPRYGEPPESDEEIKSRLRRVRVVKFLLSLVAIYAASRAIRAVRDLWRRPQLQHKPALSYDRVFGSSLPSTAQNKAM